MRLILAIFFICLSFCAFSQRDSQSYLLATLQNGTLNYEPSKSDIEQGLLSGLSREESTLGQYISLAIDDPAPSDANSYPYLIMKFYSQKQDSIYTLGLQIAKLITSEKIDYYFTQESAGNASDYGKADFRPWKCTATSACGGCNPHRGGFLSMGAVTHCNCTGGPGNCAFETTGGAAIPWSTLLTILTQILIALILP